MLYKKENILSLGYPNWNGAVTMNIGKMQATGWELSLNWRDRAGEFAYSVGINLSGVKNKALKLSGDGPVLSEDFNMDKIIRNEDGGAISRFYGFVADGIFRTGPRLSHTPTSTAILFSLMLFPAIFVSSTLTTTVLSTTATNAI